MNKEKICNPRRGKTGGEALIEGVMMKSAKRYAVSVRLEDGSIRTKVEDYHPAKEKHAFLGWPIIRGLVNFVESMVLSMKCLNYSADCLGIDEAEPETKFEKWLDRKFGDKLTGVIMGVGTVLGLILAFALFFVLPGLAGKGVNALFANSLTWQLSLVEGVIKIAVFVAYIWAVSLMRDIRRTFEYHGAEHKTIFCYESGEELTVENVKKQSRFHPRCGTAFMFVMMFVSILVFSLIYLIPGFDTENTLLRILIRLPVLPLIFGLGYEFIRFAGCHDGIIIRILCQPGLWMQRLTTREPDAEQIEVAIMSLKLSLIEEFPEAEAEAAAVAPKEDAPKEDAPVSENAEGAESTEATESVEKAESTDTTKSTESEEQA